MRATAFWICVLLPWFLAGFAAAGPAVLTVDPDYQTIGGGTMGTVVVMYDGAAVTEGLRGFHLAIEYDESLITIADPGDDVWEGSFLSHVDETAFYVVQVDPGTVVIDCAILGETAGAFGTGNLCVITFTGLEPYDGVSPVHFAEVTLRDVDNHAIAYTVDDGEIHVDNTAPPPPTIYPEPEFTQGTTNTIAWTDMSAYTAVGYCCECSEYPDFVPLHGTTGCTIDTVYTFTDLEDGVLYYYRAKCRDMWWNTSDWSSPLTTSTQDDSPPVTAAGPLNPYYNTVTFSVPFAASDATSGVQYVELYFQVDGGGVREVRRHVHDKPDRVRRRRPGRLRLLHRRHRQRRQRRGRAAGAGLLDRDRPDAASGDRRPRRAAGSQQDPPVVDGAGVPRCAGRRHAHREEGRGVRAPIPSTTTGARRRATRRTRPTARSSRSSRARVRRPTTTRASATRPGTSTTTRPSRATPPANYSAAASSAQDRATSYWLADVDEITGTPGVYDGNVDYYDKVVLSGSYWTQHGSPFYEHEMDVGPTDDWSRFGIPLTDNWVNFEDLMVLAMNYGRVSPLGRIVVPALAGGSEVGGPALALIQAGGSFAVGEEIVVDLVLAGNTGYAKGVSAVCRSIRPSSPSRRSVPSDGVAGLGDDGFFIWRHEGDGVGAHRPRAARHEQGARRIGRARDHHVQRAARGADEHRVRRHRGARRGQPGDRRGL